MCSIAGTLLVSASVNSMRTNVVIAPLTGGAPPSQVLQACASHLVVYDDEPSLEESEQAFVLRTVCR